MNHWSWYPQIICLIGNFWLIYRAVSVTYYSGSGRAQADFEVFMNIFQLGIPIALVSIVIFIYLLLTKSKEVVFVKSARFLSLVNMFLPLIIFFSLRS